MGVIVITRRDTVTRCATQTSEIDLLGLGHDLCALIQVYGSRLVRVVPLTTLPSPTNPHASYRFDFADERTVKGRRVEHDAQADRMLEILPRLDARSFSTVLMRRGNALLEQWIEGRPLREIKVGPELAVTCGSILGQVHSRPLPLSQSVREHGPDAYLAALEHNLCDLVSHASLAKHCALNALDIAASFAPARPATGFIHDDYCADNLILSAQGHPVCVDNETVSTGNCDYDLARTWYRWPMRRALIDAFLRGYGRYRDVTGFVEHFPFWAIVAVVQSAAFRMRAETDQTEIPLARLTALLEALSKDRWTPSAGVWATGD